MAVSDPLGSNLSRKAQPWDGRALEPELSCLQDMGEVSSLVVAMLYLIWGSICSHQSIPRSFLPMAVTPAPPPTSA